jgi:hypothetical protein
MERSIRTDKTLSRESFKLSLMIVAKNTHETRSKAALLQHSCGRMKRRRANAMQALYYLQVIIHQPILSEADKNGLLEIVRFLGRHVQRSEPFVRQ